MKWWLLTFISVIIAVPCVLHFTNVEDIDLLLYEIRATRIDEIRSLTNFPGSDDEIRDFYQSINRVFPQVRKRTFWDGKVPNIEACTRTAELDFNSKGTVHRIEWHDIVGRNGNFGTISYHYDNKNSIIIIECMRDLPG